MKKKSLLLASLFLGMFVIKGVSFASKEKPVIAGIYKAGDQIWFIDEGKASEKVVKELGGEKFIYIDAKMNPDTYLTAVDNVIAQKVDGVLVCVPDQFLSGVTVEKLKDANIPVVAVDDPLIGEDGKKLAPWVGIDAYNIGYSVGEWLANYAKENKLEKDPNVGVLILTMDTVSSVVPRTEGEEAAFKKILPDFPKNRIFKADYNGETDKGFNAASAIFTANPQITKWLIMGGNEEGVIGGVRALEQFGLDKDSAAIAMGAYLAIGEFEKDHSALKAAPFFSSIAIGGESAKMLMEHIQKDTPMKESTAVKAEIVTKDNYKKIMNLK